MNPFTREELWSIRAKAEQAASVKGTNRQWVRAYLALSDAADWLDAMMARTEFRLGGETPATEVDETS